MAGLMRWTRTPSNMLYSFMVVKTPPQLLKSHPAFSRFLSPRLLAIGLVLMVALHNNALEYLAEDGYSALVILFCRGVAQLAISSIVGRSIGYSLWPSNWRTQSVRMLNNGVAIYLGIVSYQYLSATTVSLLQRLDIPLLILLGQATGRQAPDRRSWLCWIAVGLVFLFALDAETLDENALGFLTGVSSILLLSLNFLLIKRSVGEENLFVFINVSSLSCILIGAAATFFTDQKGVHFHTIDYELMAGTGALQFLINLCLLALYQQLPAERAQFPAVLGAVATMLLEMWVEQKLFGVVHIGGILLITALVAYIAYSRTNRPKQVHGVDG
jgi:drug/metabolite transporter (DMT)-like permease